MLLSKDKESRMESRSYLKLTTHYLFLFLLTTSCGNTDTESAPYISLVSSEISGDYKANLRPLNTQSSGFLPVGGAEITATDEELKVKTYLDDDTKVMHIQDIYEGSRCPTIHDDTNNDGFIDIVEAKAVVGKIILALDGKLETHMAGQGEYPRGRSFTYIKETKLDYILHDFSRNFPQGIFHLSGRVILVHGTSDISRIPESVKTQNDLPRSLSLPIACGILLKKK